jgi:hypothetical protein
MKHYTSYAVYLYYFRPHRRMVRGTLKFARCLVYDAGTARKRCADQYMIDTHAVVAPEAHHAVIPPAVGFFCLLKHTKCIAQTKLLHTFESRALWFAA